MLSENQKQRDHQLAAHANLNNINKTSEMATSNLHVIDSISFKTRSYYYT